MNFAINSCILFISIPFFAYLKYFKFFWISVHIFLKCATSALYFINSASVKLEFGNARNTFAFDKNKFLLIRLYLPFSVFRINLEPTNLINEFPSYLVTTQEIGKFKSKYITCTYFECDITVDSHNSTPKIKQSLIFSALN